MTEEPTILSLLSKPAVTLDNKMLTEVKEEVTNYSNKLQETINQIQEQAAFYEKDAAKKAMTEILSEQVTELTAKFDAILSKLETLTPNADLEKEVLLKFKSKLEAL